MFGLGGEVGVLIQTKCDKLQWQINHEVHEACDLFVPQVFAPLRRWQMAADENIIGVNTKQIVRWSQIYLQSTYIFYYD